MPVVLGVIASLTVVVFTEWLRKPRLIISLEPPINLTYDLGGHPKPANGGRLKTGQWSEPGH